MLIICTPRGRSLQGRTPNSPSPQLTLLQSQRDTRTCPPGELAAGRPLPHSSRRHQATGASETDGAQNPSRGPVERGDRLEHARGGTGLRLTRRLRRARPGFNLTVIPLSRNLPLFRPAPRPAADPVPSRNAFLPPAPHPENHHPPPVSLPPPPAPHHTLSRPLPTTFRRPRTRASSSPRYLPRAFLIVAPAEGGGGKPADTGNQHGTDRAAQIQSPLRDLPAAMPAPSGTSRRGRKSLPPWGMMGVVVPRGSRGAEPQPAVGQAPRLRRRERRGGLHPRPPFCGL